ncbi:MAG: hypothetical protein VXZ53_23815, partial [Planctomycetota bacterium]|nr:hypothetical protein [Planctomycetota bacterium]
GLRDGIAEKNDPITSVQLNIHFLRHTLFPVAGDLKRCFFHNNFGLMLYEAIISKRRAGSADGGDGFGRLNSLTRSQPTTVSRTTHLATASPR